MDEVTTAVVRATQGRREINAWYAGETRPAVRTPWAQGAPSRSAAAAPAPFFLQGPPPLLVTRSPSLTRTLPQILHSPIPPPAVTMLPVSEGHHKCYLLPCKSHCHRHPPSFHQAAPLDGTYHTVWCRNYLCSQSDPHWNGKTPLSHVTSVCLPGGSQQHKC